MQRNELKMKPSEAGEAKPTSTSTPNSSPTSTPLGLQGHIKPFVTNYFKHLGDEKPKDLYNLVINEVELPLLETMLKYTKYNQSKAAIYLGLSRGTLRQRMMAHRLLDKPKKAPNPPR